MRMSRELTFLSFFLIMSVLEVKTVNFTPQNCGDEKMMSGLHGIIQTPNFPNPFPVPIRCRWVIDASGYHNATIYIYFTQMFVTTGLKIADYSYYDKNDSTGLAVGKIFELPSRKTLKVDHLSTDWSYSVIDFELNQLEGNHVRALHNLMNVFGFNITYEISLNGRKSEACTVSDCSLAGNCYASQDFS